MALGLKEMLIIGGRVPVPPTTSEAVLLIAPVPPSLEVTFPVWLLYVPAVPAVTCTPVWQDAPAASVTPERLSEVEPAPVPVKVPPQELNGVEPTTVRPPVSVSESAIPVSVVAPLGFWMKMTSVLSPPTAMAVGLNETVTTGD